MGYHPLVYLFINNGNLLIVHEPQNCSGSQASDVFVVYFTASLRGKCQSL